MNLCPVAAEPMHEDQSTPNAYDAARVLVVDDYIVDRRIAGGIVEKITGARPAFAANGMDALRLIAEHPPSVVLTDLQMPEMDGLRLVEEIRERFPRLPVILMTAYGSEEVAIQALRAGAANYVPKKALAKELGDTLNRVLNASSLDRDRQRVLSVMEHRESRFVIENDPALINPLINLLQEDLGGMEVCNANDRMRVGVALQEALANAIYHGNLEVSSDLRQEDERIYYQTAEERRDRAPYRDRRVTVHARFDRRGATYTIRDEGPGFDTSSLDRPIELEDLMRVGGRGMLLIRTFMDEVTHNPTGNRITLVKRSKPGA
jgi:CheY-like chemotaxis protein